MENYVIKLELAERAESARIRTVKAIISAVNYTDAERQGFEMYENQFTEEYDMPNVATINPIKFSKTYDLLNAEQIEQEEDEFAKVFSLKVNMQFKGELGKKVSKTILCRAMGYMDVISRGITHVKRFYNAEVVNMVEVKETDIYPRSPLFLDLPEEDQD